MSSENQTVETMVESLATEVVGRMDIDSVGKSVERMVCGMVVLTVIYSVATMVECLVSYLAEWMVYSSAVSLVGNLVCERAAMSGCALVAVMARLLVSLSAEYWAFCYNQNMNLNFKKLKIHFMVPFQAGVTFAKALRVVAYSVAAKGYTAVDSMAVLKAEN